MVIIYKLKAFTYFLAQILINTEMVGLVNIVAQELVAPELIQGDATPDNIAKEALLHLNDPERLQAVRARLLKIRESLGEPGVMDRVAKSICRYLDEQTENEEVTQ